MNEELKVTNTGRRILWEPHPEGLPTTFDEAFPTHTGEPMNSIFYYPNRPTLIPPDEARLKAMEASGQYIAERKYNGDNVLISTDTFQFWNRHKEKHRFVPDEAMRAELTKWPKHAIINAELMNYRTKTIKNIIYVHCVMVWKGKPLIGKTWGDSRKILEEECPKGDYARISEIFQTGFWQLFQEADGSIIEGIILKKPAGRLVHSATPIDDVSWMLKIRKPCKKYQF